MAFTPTAILPLPSTPNVIFTDLWCDYNTTQPSDTAAFDTGIDGRDNGVCIVCGFDDYQALKHCHIIPLTEPDTWEFMQSLGYIPNNAKSVSHESRNGILMCPNHCVAFDHYQFYIRWNSEANEFVVVNHSRLADYESIHGNVLHFDTNTKRCPFPTAFLWHEYRVRGFHPTYGDRPVTIKRGSLQGGYFSRRHGAGVLNDGAHGCDGGEGHGYGGVGAGEQVEGHDASVSGHDDMKPLTFTPMRLEGHNLAAWLKAAREHSSWKDCVVENLSWNGTAEENVEKYQHEVGALSNDSIERREGD
ncbi:hypothetical protein BDZ97DRAFT_1917438 [Flammula alnicola]|nr:hypothetical protein BDZ97DRAFT_1917438 [Flammula alnicola]